VAKGTTAAHHILDGKNVPKITAYLFHSGSDDDPRRLAGNHGKVFHGSVILGPGFVFSRDVNSGYHTLDKLSEIIAEDPRSQDRIFEYIGGKDLNTDPLQSSTRRIINFGMVTEAEARRWPVLFSVVHASVRPYRQTDKRETRRRNWWRYGEPTPALYETIAPMQRVLAIAQTSNALGFVFKPANLVFDQTVVVIALDTCSAFSVLQSRVHLVWVYFLGATMKEDRRYIPSDCFETFPFAVGFESSPTLEAVGQSYHEERAALMVARNEGMTKIYNRFHDPDEHSEDIVRLRELHADMDRAVLRAYGWDDLAERAEPVFLDETNEDDYTYQGRLFWPSAFRDEVLARLLALNAERAAAERAAGLAPRAAATDRDAEEDEAA
jgi:hypothetical protein